MRPSKDVLLIQALSACLRERRLELAMTQEDVAGLAELDRPYITHIESARKQPTISVLWKLSLALQLSPAEFVARIDQRHAVLRKLAAKATSSPRRHD